MTEYLLPVIFIFFSEESFIGSLLSAYPLILFALVLLPFIIIGAVVLLFDFIKDSWKMFFGIALDIAAIFVFAMMGNALLGLALVSAGIFYLLAYGKMQKAIYASIGAARMLILLPFIPLPEVLKIILLLIPICTITMFFVCITD
ncbi:hypothetical protein JW826_03775 [Candidatus Woesearchaeota archaeon]|nr:hypothetical protein [Candidatus Woesearchaeota archaeon]